MPLNRKEKPSTTLDPQLAISLARIDQELIHKCLDAVMGYYEKLRDVLRIQYKWVDKAITDVVNDNTAAWHKLHQATKEIVDVVRDNVRLADSTELEIPDKTSIHGLHNDACKLKQHVQNGGSIGWGPFRPKWVNESLRSLKNVRINGRLCNNSERWCILADILNVRVEFDKIRQYWAEYFEWHDEPYSMRLQILDDLVTALEKIFSLGEALIHCRNTLEQCAVLAEPTWKDESQIRRLSGHANYLWPILTKFDLPLISYR